MSIMDFQALTDPHPLGIHRMKRWEGVPSRSYLKLEEAFQRMGVAPKPGEEVVDLGAAPGGWTFACLRRGADVVAVDRGPLRLPVLDGINGSVTQLQEDGFTFTPSRPVHWMISDMLIPPGQAMGLLKRWFSNRWAAQIVCNLKIPQQQPWIVIEPLTVFMREYASYNVRIRQLYHDRREVTVMAVPARAVDNTEPQD